ncbi:hypothetical protein PM8797T_24181 [Gimesia maris DSM 8797]|nr:hypothetical protein PM8797T_24181 [Gimesia maris DSM 8797]
MRAIVKVSVYFDSKNPSLIIPVFN